MMLSARFKLSLNLCCGYEHERTAGCRVLKPITATAESEERHIC